MITASVQKSAKPLSPCGLNDKPLAGHNIQGFFPFSLNREVLGAGKWDKSILETGDLLA
ncbi:MULTISPECIES: hypothetical protein [unclassified Nostoc]|uniref:hypothetical protein n=1 Tax=unclassified Nostoc TaxID=2593658 RepID=UPI0025FCB2E3|nr:hypothetical protein [Nostoc sp. JL31]MBN3893441.1 hypothetical protein [Nostoc sp. JL31]